MSERVLKKLGMHPEVAATVAPAVGGLLAGLPSG
jgi:hypothetical protein